jgi:hypothetical protein
MDGAMVCLEVMKVKEYLEVLGVDGKLLLNGS